ncbi:Dynamin family-domain-containing protein, partial [Baffinella frigidus]
PQVVMIGQQSSGKSSILERLAMMPLFPRGEGTITRLPIHVHLRNAETSLPPTLEVVDTATNKTVRGPYVVPSISGHLDVSQQMDQILQEEQRGLKGVSSTRRIVLHIENRHVPSIDLVDLPG